MVTLSIALATLCFNGACYPALVGEETPKGIFQLELKATAHPGYGGDVLRYLRTGNKQLAIHRVWLLRPEQHRLERLASSNPADRVITKGCINIMPEVYDKLKECCSNETLMIN
jgi:hypothetical protein